ncbi:methyltransferase domain-containing protein [Allosaccharopolyspora coralli]|uniref:Methyltransferase domain-containing protein n=1 Tax=Allosaccharopolyspora coralli TaxID=2665642 RepID=A0A5Q3QFL7_9PSEU|nr:methyltransferase domain-containing protein [Allosaccharopolyspora coralli]QGK69617.1 methyltransferase domain-containing protein [Allosaccharopolyspora coralli]
MLQSVVDVLACPHCGQGLAAAEGSLRCPVGHTFDLAKQGYVSLLAGAGTGIDGDDAAMVAARHEVLEAGHYTPVGEHVAREAARVTPAGGAVLDVGAGTGYYLREALAGCPDSPGVALDVSKYACRRAAKADPRIGAVLADAWRALPLLDGSVSTVLNVFAPRHAAEMARVLRPGGHLVVVTPEPRHLVSLVDRLGLITVDERKRQRLDEQLGDRFEPVTSSEVTFGLSLSLGEAEAVAAMGPSARHVAAAELRDRLAELPEPVETTAAVTATTYRLRTSID